MSRDRRVWKVPDGSARNNLEAAGGSAKHREESSINEHQQASISITEHPREAARRGLSLKSSLLGARHEHHGFGLYKGASRPSRNLSFSHQNQLQQPSKQAIYFMRFIKRVPSTLNTSQTPTSSYKVSKVPASKTHKQPKNLSTMTFLPHLVNGDFAPFFPLMDDCDTRRSLYITPTASRSRSFSPKFDVKEHADYYQLDGELPGINQKDIEIEFSDPQTIVIKGSSKRESSSTNLDVDTEPSKQIDDDETSSRSSLQPTVEDEDETQTGTTTGSTPPEKQVTNPGSSTPKKAPAFKYWLAERSTGKFQRSFSFSSRVDQDKVRASLKDGILSIAVPKATVPTSKKIRID